MATPQDIKKLKKAYEKAQKTYSDAYEAYITAAEADDSAWKAYDEAKPQPTPEPMATQEEKSEAVEILKDYFKALAGAYIKQFKMIEEYNKLRAKQKEAKKQKNAKKGR